MCRKLDRSIVIKLQGWRKGPAHHCGQHLAGSPLLHPRGARNARARGPRSSSREGTVERTGGRAVVADVRTDERILQASPRSHGIFLVPLLQSPRRRALPTPVFVRLGLLTGGCSNAGSSVGWESSESRTCALPVSFLLAVGRALWCISAVRLSYF
jgi:hypothetical protein